MKISVTADIELEAPAYVTWLDVRLVDRGRTCATARLALLHVGEIADAAGEIWPAIHGTKLEALHEVYFSQGWYRDEYADGAGIDLLYVESVDVEPGHEGKNLDLALVRRLCETIGSGCQLVVMPYGEATRAAHWGQLGFAVSTPGRPNGLMHIKLGYRLASVVDATGSGDYEVLGATAASLPPVRSAAN